MHLELEEIEAVKFQDMPMEEEFLDLAIEILADMQEGFKIDS
jgi:hypothetical protein